MKPFFVSLLLAVVLLLHCPAPAPADYSRWTQVPPGTVNGQTLVWFGSVWTLAAPTTVTQRTARVPVPALLSGASTSLSVIWSKPEPDANYSIAATVYDPAVLLGNVVVTAKTMTGCTLSVKDVGLTSLTASTADVELTATHD